MIKVAGNIKVHAKSSRSFNKGSYFFACSWFFLKLLILILGFCEFLGFLGKSLGKLLTKDIQNFYQEFKGFLHSAKVVMKNFGVPRYIYTLIEYILRSSIMLFSMMLGIFWPKSLPILQFSPRLENLKEFVSCVLCNKKLKYSQIAN